MSTMTHKQKRWAACAYHWLVFLWFGGRMISDEVQKRIDEARETGELDLSDNQIKKRLENKNNRLLKLVLIQLVLGYDDKVGNYVVV